MQSPASDDRADRDSNESSTRNRISRQRIDRYSIQRLLASGGGSDVFLASHAYTALPVALKVLHEGAERRARFASEVEALARVRGPGIVELLDAGEHDELQFIACRALDGRSLDGLVAARGQLSVPDTLKIGLALARALERCHAHGVIHRDVKPANVFIGAGPGSPVTLLDFGIAKLDRAGMPTVKLTRENTLLGTPEYMAPEALLLSSDCDHRVDVYGLGVTLYECLTGRVPFEGNYADVLMKLSTSAPPPIETLREGVPAALAQLIQRALQRAPVDRFQDLTEFRTALESLPSDPDHYIDLFGRSVAVPRAEQPKSTVADSPLAKATPEQGQYRRQYPRAPYVALARVALSSGAQIDGRIEEISEGGLQFVGADGVPAGVPATIRLALPVSGRIRDVSATARWSRAVRANHATGFEFAELAPETRAEIRQYVELMCAESRDAD